MPDGAGGSSSYILSFDEYSDNVREAEVSFILAGPNLGSWKVRHCPINPVVLQEGVEGGSKIAHGISRSDALLFLFQHPGFLAERTIFDGHVARSYDFAVVPPSTHFLVSTVGPSRWLSITLPLGMFAKLVAQAGRPDLEGIQKRKCIVSTPPKSARIIIREALKLMANPNRNSGSPDDLLDFLVSAIIGAVKVTSLSENNGRSSIKIVSKALEHARHLEWEALRVDELARAAEVTERTLRRTFNHQFEMGPAKYLRLRLLNIVRRALRSMSGPQQNITAIMSAHGIGEFGRFAGAYRALFGERPSDTARRARAIQSDR